MSRGRAEEILVVVLLVGAILIVMVLVILITKNSFLGFANLY